MIHVKVGYVTMSNEQLDEVAVAMADMIICHIQDRKNRERKSKESKNRVNKDIRPGFVFKFLTRSQFEDRSMRETSEKIRKRKPVERDSKGKEIIEVFREVNK